MEPITLILTALATGVAAGTASASESAIRDAYTGLKTLIQRRFAGKDKAQHVLEEYIDDPSTYEKPMAKQLQETGAAEDESIIRAAQILMATAKPDQAAQGAFNIKVKGNVYSLVQNNQGEVTNTFNFEKDQ
jgi:hypothetical protein